MTCPAMTAGPSAPGEGPREYQPTSAGRGVSITPRLSPRGTSFDRTPILGIDTETGSDSGRTNPLIWSRRSVLSARSGVRSEVGWLGLGDVDGMLCPFGAPVNAEPGVDGLASPAHTSTAPITASPTAIKALTSRLERKLVESTISFDPLIDSVGTDPKCRGAAERQHQLATVARLRRIRYCVTSILSQLVALEARRKAEEPLRYLERSFQIQCCVQ